jgi:hypothetical protein
MWYNSLQMTQYLEALSGNFTPEMIAVADAGNAN